MPALAIAAACLLAGTIAYCVVVAIAVRDYLAQKSAHAGDLAVPAAAEAAGDRPDLVGRVGHRWGGGEEAVQVGPERGVAAEACCGLGVLVDTILGVEAQQARRVLVSPGLQPVCVVAGDLVEGHGDDFLSRPGRGRGVPR